MWQMGGPGPMFGQVHHFVKYNKGKAPYAEECYLKEAHRLYSVLDRAQHEFVADDYSIADAARLAITVYQRPWVSRYEWQTVDLNACANVKCSGAIRRRRTLATFLCRDLESGSFDGTCRHRRRTCSIGWARFPADEGSGRWNPPGRHIRLLKSLNISG